MSEKAPPIRWLRTGDEAFAAMLAAIAAARRSVRLEMYIISPGALADAFRDALVEAQRRGVRVRVLIDALGSFSLPGDFFEPLIRAGGEFRRFNPLKVLRIEFRDHRKILVCDEAVAVIGGFNIAPEYQGDGVNRGWCDLGLEIQGPLAEALATAVDESFARADFKFDTLRRLHGVAARRTCAAENWRLLLSGPGLGYNFLKRTLMTDLANAQRVQFISAYFLPAWRLRRELRRVVRRGGRVQLILAGKSDVLLSQWASRRLYAALMEAGVEIYEYKPQVLHTKLYLVDQQVYVGSANIDTRSLDINYELLVRLADPAEVRAAEEIFAENLRHSVRLQLESWVRSRSLWTKLLERVAYFVLARMDTTWARRHLRNLP